MSSVQKFTKVNNESNFLFLTFECPYCEKQNVLNKSYVSIEVICSNSGCRRVVVLDSKALVKESPVLISEPLPLAQVENKNELESDFVPIDENERPPVENIEEKQNLDTSPTSIEDDKNNEIQDKQTSEAA